VVKAKEDLETGWVSVHKTQRTGKFCYNRGSVNADLSRTITVWLQLRRNE
jgi:hypothetical protein